MCDEQSFHGYFLRQEFLDYLLGVFVTSDTGMT